MIMHILGSVKGDGKADDDVALQPQAVDNESLASTGTTHTGGYCTDATEEKLNNIDLPTTTKKSQVY